MSVLNASWKSLTVRQKQVLLRILEGTTRKNLAFALGISIRTLEFHRYKAFRKLGLKNDVQLVRFAVRNRVIEA